MKTQQETGAIRVLIVDDSPTLRLLIRNILVSDPDFEVVGEARNGREAIVLCEKLEPDLVTMDIRMPVMDGYEAIRYIMAECPRPIVVVTSTISDEELQISYRAIEAGALMVIGKPRDLPGQDPEADQLLRQLKAMADVKVVGRRRNIRRGPRAVSPGKPDPRPGRSPVRVVAVGASTGGPPALHVILGQLPADLGVPLVVVQHISPDFVAGLARWLDQTTPLPVKVAEDGEQLRPGSVYLAPDDRHLLVTKRGRVRLADTPPVDGHRPSATALFESVARAYGSLAVGIVLSGMGSDGARGLKALHDAGAATLAQDEASSVVFGMPREAIALGAVWEVLPLEEIGVRLLETVRLGPTSGQREGRP